MEKQRFAQYTRFNESIRVLVHGFFQLSDGTLSEISALVEFPDGTMHEVNPSNLKFENPQEAV